MSSRRMPVKKKKAARETGVLPQDRPLRGLDAVQLQSRFVAALQAADGEAGAHCIHELWLGGAFPARIETLQDELWQRASASVPEWLPMRYVHWLPLAYDVAARFSAQKTGRSHIYLVLLDFADRRSGDAHGVYVGMSQYRAAQRFDQHMAGIRASGSVLKRGLEVLTGPVLHLQYIARAEAVRIEGELAAALADAGLRVEGGH
ncbi:MAG: hypothetical protein ABIT36_11890 [Steroidobacteraceae bacterium]